MIVDIGISLRERMVIVLRMALDFEVEVRRKKGRQKREMKEAG